MTGDDQTAKPKTSTRDRDDIAARLAEWLRDGHRSRRSCRW